MTLLIAFAVVLTVSAVVAAVLREVRSGGTSPAAPPAHAWTDDTEPPERPYRDLPRVA